MCGLLSDKANQQSKFLMLEKGESKVVRFKNFKFIPSSYDPDMETVRYELDEQCIDGAKTKYWTNGNARIMKFMDTVPLGSFVKITREKFVSKEGKEDTGKSSYVVELCDDTGKVVKGKTAKDEAWDE